MKTSHLLHPSETSGDDDPLHRRYDLPADGAAHGHVSTYRDLPVVLRGIVQHIIGNVRQSGCNYKNSANPTSAAGAPTTITRHILRIKLSENMSHGGENEKESESDSDDDTLPSKVQMSKFVTESALESVKKEAKEIVAHCS